MKRKKDKAKECTIRFI